jgi:hypothetical protein
MSFSDIERAKTSASERLAGIDGVLGFGVGDGTVRVYVQRSDVGQRLPEEVDGIPIEVVVTGTIDAL